MFPILPSEATEDFNRVFMSLERLHSSPGTKKALERYRESATHPRALVGVRESLSKIERENLLHLVEHHPMMLHLAGIMAFDTTEASTRVLQALVDDTLSAIDAEATRTASKPARRVTLLDWIGSCRRVLTGAPGPAAAELCARARAMWSKLFPASLAGVLTKSIGAEVPDDRDASFSLTHMAEAGYAQVVASSGGDVHAVFAVGHTRYIVVDRDGLCDESTLPKLDEVAKLREHFEQCVASQGLDPWTWGKLQAQESGPYGSVVKVHGFKPGDKKAIEAWWLGGRPVGGRPVKPPPPVSRYEPFIPKEASEAERKTLRAVFRGFDAAEGAPYKPQHFERIRSLAENARLVETLIAWWNQAADRDYGHYYVLGILAIDGSAAALAIVDSAIQEELATGTELVQIWDYARLLRECRPTHPLLDTLREAWRARFEPTLGARLLRSMGVSPPTDRDWEVVLMARQPRGDTIIEIYPGGFFRAEANVDGPAKERLGIREAPDRIEDIREHFDACAREAALEPWNLAEVWDPLERPNGAIVDLKGFPREDAKKITSWFRDWMGPKASR